MLDTFFGYVASRTVNISGWMGMDTENNADSRASTGAPTTFRVFLASPGDVPLERKLAREAIAHVGGERRFRGRVDIEIVAWDQPGAAVAMEAGLTPQEAIAQGLPKPEDCDLAVVVIWSRIGTQLPADFELKADGTPYLSGTEWEYLNALSGFKARRKPAVWVYRRPDPPMFAANAPDLAARLDQWQKVERFFAAFTNPDGSLAGGINHYETPDDFRRQFEAHLRDRLDKLLETLPPREASNAAKAASLAPRWEHAPYPGLESFSPEQAPIFFGRGKEVDLLLAHFADPRTRFVAVVGVSGSGKSSLVKAGLLPRLRTGIVGHARWIDLTFKPGERGGNPFLALAFVLKAELGLSGQTEQELARTLQGDPQAVATHLASILAKHPEAADLLLVIDQFEEVFTQATAGDRKDFLALLEHLVAAPRLRVIVTMRADFYAEAVQQPTLARLLRRDRGTFPLDAPGVGALHEMIVRPAEAAGLELEDGLAQRLLDDAGPGPGAMALIAFTLSQLYERSDKQHITVKDCEAFGGVKGAVQQRAEAALRGLPETGLPPLFAELVEVNEQEVATRRRALKSRVTGDARTVANVLVEARLLVTGEGENNEPTLEVAHETVLNGWTRLKDWIAQHAESLRARRDLERVAAEWDKAQRHGDALRTGKLLQRYLSAAEPRSTVADAYLAACKRRRNWARGGYAGLGLLAVLGLGVFYHVSQTQYPPALATRALLVQIGVWPLTRPRMETISAGEFEMGDPNGDTDEHYVRTVRFAKDFEIGKYEVTFDEYDLFAAATGRRKPSDNDWGRNDRPVIDVSWEDAVAYTNWLSGQTGQAYRLPSEAEWEYAARAKTTTVRYWPEAGEGEPDAACGYANVLDAKNHSRIKASYAAITWEHFKCEDAFPFTAPVGQFTANKWNLHDMLGNVWEWNQDCYTQSYEQAPDDGAARKEVGTECALRVLRGGSWYDDPDLVRSANRYRFAPDYRGINIGFRLARTL
ncbi:MAG: SUMF1/EgtB/PvdO family nonheme iron enzyme [Thiotrichales bacterium]